MLESAVDKNISFRLKGSSCLNINDVNIMNLIGTVNQSAVPNSNLALRLSALEEQFHQISTVGSDTIPSYNHDISQRLNALERRMGNGRSNFTLNNFNRRIRQLETKINKLTTRLNTNNCTSNPCLNGGMCTNTFGGYACQCPETWTGANCDEDVNECVDFANSELGCQNALSCENTPGGYLLVNLLFLHLR